jgi:predicted nuclease of predicted toxin-antitoxin system
VSVGLYLDHNAHRALLAALRHRDVDVIDTAEDGTDRVADEVLLERASTARRAVVTHDRDFLRIGARWAALGRPHAGIADAHQHALSMRNLIDNLEYLALAYESYELEGRVIFLPL